MDEQWLWNPVDLAPGLRLYRVVTRYHDDKSGICRHDLTEHHIVAEKSPTAARERIERQNADVKFLFRVSYKAEALNVHRPLLEDEK